MATLNYVIRIYPPGNCEYSVLVQSTLIVTSFGTISSKDILKINNTEYSGIDGPAI